MKTLQKHRATRCSPAGPGTLHVCVNSILYIRICRLIADLALVRAQLFEMQQTLFGGVAEDVR